MIKRFGLAGVFAGMVVLACLGIAGCSEDDNPAHVHNYGDWETVKAPTCSEEGLRQHKCSSCGNIESGAIQAKGHDYGEWVVDQEADKDHIGKKHHDCNSCGNSECVDDASEFFSHGGYGKQMIDYDGVARQDKNDDGIANDENYGDLNTGDECLMNKKARDPNSKYYGKKHDHYLNDNNQKYVRWDMNDNGIFYDSKDEEEEPFYYRTKNGKVWDEENNLISN